MLRSHLQRKKTVKRINDTKWSARVDAMAVLLDIAAVENEKPLDKAEAKSVRSMKMLT